MVTSKQIFDYLPGIWKISRKTLTSLRSWQNSGAACIVANGYAAFIVSKADPDTLIYSEKVIVHNQNSNQIEPELNSTNVAKQKYKYRYDRNTQDIIKFFSDDRLFYKISITSEAQSNVNGANTTVVSGNSVIQACGEHLCVQDSYVANYDFNYLNSGEEKFTLKYSITGPKKCYEIINEFERIHDPNFQELGIQIENEIIL